jgi:hypothetical protein
MVRWLSRCAVLIVLGVLSLDQAAAQPPAPNVQPGQTKISRWLELETATVTTRYRYIESSRGEVLANQDQYQDILRGRFKFDSRGRYSIFAGISTGTSFIGGWDSAGWGTGDAVTNHYLKQLGFSAAPLHGVELQYGGLYVLRGEATEITTYDNDAYIVGQRLRLKRPKELFFDEISVTYGYLGDVALPNLNKRFHRLKQSNYHQWLVTKSIGSRAAVSAGYSFQDGIETLRQAVRLRTPELRLLDLVRFEDYERTDVHPDYGFAVTGEKSLHRRLTVGGGYADIDRNYGGLNGDRWMSGRRLYATAAFVLCPEFTVSAFLTHAVKTGFPISNATRIEVLFSYNLLESLRRTSLF